MYKHRLNRKYLNRNDDIIARSSSVGTWFGSFLTVGIFILTVEVVRLNRINVYLNMQNVINNRASAKSGEAILTELKEINKSITRTC